MTKHALNPLACRVRDSLLHRHTAWSEYANTLSGGDLELALPAPRGSAAGHLVIFTVEGRDTWVRYAPPRACYSVDTEGEMHAVVDALLSDSAFFVVVSNGDDWVETSLLRPGEEPVLAEGQVARIFSWSGRHDRIVTYTEKSPARGA